MEINRLVSHGENGMKSCNLNHKYEFENHIKEIRISKGFTQSDLAIKSGCSRNTIASLENNISEPSAYLAGRLSEALGVKFEDLFVLKEKGG